MVAREARAWSVRGVVIVVITAVAVVMSGCTRAADAPPPSPTSTEGGGTPVVDASSELEKLPDVEQFLEQAVAQVRQKYPDQVPEDFTAASIMGELDVIDSHVQADGVLDYAAATSDPAITADTLDPYARTYRALGGELTGTGTADVDATGGNDAGAAVERSGHDDASLVSVEYASAVRFRAADEGQGEKEDDPRVGYQGPRQFVSGGPEHVDDYEAIGNGILQGKVFYFDPQSTLTTIKPELEAYLYKHVGEDQKVVYWGYEKLDGSFGVCTVNTEVYYEYVLEQGAEGSDVCLTRTVSGSTVPEPPLPIGSPMPESAVAIEADVQQLIIQELWPIVKDFIGLTDLEKCFTEADILACMMTLINLLPVGKAIKVVKAIPAVARAVEKIVTFLATKGKKYPVAAPLGCFRSFAGSTPVLMADGTHRPIEDIEVGDRVVATNPETGEQVEKKVTHVWVHQDDLFEFEVDDELIVTTEDHPFWSVTDQAWEGTEELALGERVLTAQGRTLPVTREVDFSTRRGDAAYNLTVSGLHTYHVGESDALVHNAGGPPPVDNERLQNLVNTIFKGVGNPNQIGDGTTMAAAAHELAGGEQVEGRNHVAKAHQMRSALTNFLNNDTIRVRGGKSIPVVRSERDVEVAQGLIAALDDSIAGSYSGLRGYSGLGGCS